MTESIQPFLHADLSYPWPAHTSLISPTTLALHHLPCPQKCSPSAFSEHLPLSAWLLPWNSIITVSTSTIFFPWEPGARATVQCKIQNEAVQAQNCGEVHRGEAQEQGRKREKRGLQINIEILEWEGRRLMLVWWVYVAKSCEPAR